MKRLLKKIYYSIKIDVEFFKDKQFFKKNYMAANKKEQNMEYHILLLSHSIEKGLTNKIAPRPFGSKKIKELSNLLIEYKKSNYNIRFSYHLGMNILRKYIEFYEKNNYKDQEEYIYIKRFLNDNYDNINLNCGCVVYTPTINKSDYYSLISSRHSVREFLNEKITKEELEYAVKCASQTPSACNRQMVKIHFYANNSDKIAVINSYAQGLTGFDITNINYAIITYDESAFILPGERNQGMLNSGLFATNFINALHEIEIGSCFIQFANDFKEEKKIKKILNFKQSERIAVIIALGKYKKQYYVPASLRKPTSEILIEE